MAVKPTVDPKWSTTNNPSDNIEPTVSLKNGGVPAGGVWGREFLNWQFFAISQWIDWVRSSALDKDNNLSDLTNVATARTNLGLNNASVTLGANTTGSAAKWTTARTITLGGDLSGDVSIDGSANVTLSAQVSNDSHTHSASTITAATTSVAGVTQLNDTVTSNLTTQAATANAARLAYNRAAEYAPSKTGTGASGTWGISITGNAATATKLATARTIGGVSFDGTANIDLPGVNAAGNQDTTGNAATATKLATARTINGTAFDGSTNITIPQTAFHPIGMTYIQFPGRSSPSELFGGTWSQLFNTEGVFFRTEGGNASVFGGGIQPGAVQSHSHSASSSSAGGHTHSIPLYHRSGEGATATGAGAFSTSVNTSSAGEHTHTVTVYSAGDVETRPINRTIRVWVRTA